MIVVNQRSLHEAVKIAKKVTDKIKKDTRTNFQPLKNIFISNEDNEFLFVRAKNQNDVFVGINVLASKNEKELMPIVLNPNNLVNVLSGADKNDMVKIYNVESRTEPDKTITSTSKFEMTNGSANLKIPENIDAPEFPSPDIKYEQKITFSPDEKDLLWKLKKLRTIISKDETRRNINCVHFEKNVGVATDGHRMFIIEFDNNFSEINIPTETLDLMLSVMNGKETKVFFGKNGSEEWVRVECGNCVVEQMTGGIKYPNYREVLPKKDGRNDSLVEFDRKVLSAAITKIKNITAKHRNHVMTANMNSDRFTISVSSFDFGDFSLSVPFTQHSGKDFKIGFDSNYLFDAISSARKTKLIVARLGSNLDPVRIDLEDDGIVAVVMPVRI